MPDSASPTLSLRACSFCPLDVDSRTRGRYWGRGMYSLDRSGRPAIADYSDGRLLPPTKERSEGGHSLLNLRAEGVGKASKQKSVLE
jgi:hypothetical protein